MTKPLARASWSALKAKYSGRDITIVKQDGEPRWLRRCMVREVGYRVTVLVNPKNPKERYTMATDVLGDLDFFGHIKVSTERKRRRG